MDLEGAGICIHGIDVNDDDDVTFNDDGFWQVFKQKMSIETEIQRQMRQWETLG